MWKVLQLSEQRVQREWWERRGRKGGHSQHSAWPMWRNQCCGNLLALSLSSGLPPAHLLLLGLVIWTCEVMLDFSPLPPTGSDSSGHPCCSSAGVSFSILGFLVSHATDSSNFCPGSWCPGQESPGFYPLSLAHLHWAKVLFVGLFILSDNVCTAQSHTEFLTWNLVVEQKGLCVFQTSIYLFFGYTGV